MKLCGSYNVFFCIKKQVRTWTFVVLFGIAFINWWVVECVPLSVAGIAAFRRIMAEINLAWVIDYADQVIDGVFDRGMTALLN